MRLVAAALALSVAACGDNGGTVDQTTTTTTVADTTTTTVADTTTTTAAPQPVTVPPLTGTTLSMARDNAEEHGLKVESIDLQPSVLGDPHSRAQFDYTNWIVLGQCPTAGSTMTTGDTIQVGVLKLGEQTPLINSMSVDGSFDDLVCELERET